MHTIFRAAAIALSATAIAFIAPTSHAANADPAGYLYVCDGAVEVYPAVAGRPKRLARLSNCTSVAVGAHGLVYAQYYDKIYEFERGQTTVAKTIPQPTGYQIGQYFVAGRDGSIYEDMSSIKTGNVAVLQLTPSGVVSRVIAYGPNGYVYGMTADRSGNLFVATVTSSSGASGIDVLVYAPGSTTPMADLKTPALEGGLAFDGHGNLLIGRTNGVSALALPSGRVVHKIETVGSPRPFALDTVTSVLFAAQSGVVASYGYDRGRPLGFIPVAGEGVAIDDGMP